MAFSGRSLLSGTGITSLDLSTAGINSLKSVFRPVGIINNMAPRSWIAFDATSSDFASGFCSCFPTVNKTTILGARSFDEESSAAAASKALSILLAPPINGAFSTAASNPEIDIWSLILVENWCVLPYVATAALVPGISAISVLMEDFTKSFWSVDSLRDTDSDESIRKTTAAPRDGGFSEWQEL